VTSVYVICNQIKEYIDNGKQYVKKIETRVHAY